MALKPPGLPCRWIRVALPLQSAAAVAGGGWRVDLFANTVAHERSRAAVARFSERVAGEGPGDDGASMPLLKLLAGTVPPGACRVVRAETCRHGCGHGCGL
jgi:hypothetical protein